MKCSPLQIYRMCSWTEWQTQWQVPYLLLCNSILMVTHTHEYSTYARCPAEPAPQRQTVASSCQSFVITNYVRGKKACFKQRKCVVVVHIYIYSYIDISDVATDTKIFTDTNTDTEYQWSTDTDTNTRNLWSTDTNT